MKAQTNNVPQIHIKKLGWMNKTPKRTVWIKIFWDEFFTLYPEYTVDLVMGFVDNQYYCIAAELAAKYENMMEQLKFCNVTLVAGMTETGYPFWFPIYEPRNEDEEEKIESIQAILDRADECWVKLNQKTGFDKVKTKSFHRELKPEMPLSMSQLLKNSFPGHYFIGTESHPLLQNERRDANWMNDIEEE